MLPSLRLLAVGVGSVVGPSTVVHALSGGRPDEHRFRLSTRVVLYNSI